MKVLVLGATGMLGHTLFHYVHGGEAGADRDIHVVGTVRSANSVQLFPASMAGALRTGVDATDSAALERLFDQEQPDVVVNCVGVVKQLADAKDPLVTVPINTLLPHQLARLCGDSARLVHVSTDCVFSGVQGNYRETDVPDALDLYGRSKLLGEVEEGPAVTLRTSIIGPELREASGLLEWFLSEATTPGAAVNGFTHAFFSGLTTYELSRVICDYVLDNRDLVGLYQVSSERIAKYDLLHIIAQAYDLDVTINADSSLQIDRSLNSEKFGSLTGYAAPSWDTMIAQMRHFQISLDKQYA